MPTGRPPARSPSRRVSTGSMTAAAGSSTWARPRTCGPRLNSYFADFAGLHPRTQSMLTSAAGVDWTVVGTEVEALQLEYSWIKEFDPRFNVRYRDDKSYPYLAVTMDEEYPRVMVMRGARRRGTRYFGPYSHAWAIRETVDTLLRVFPVRTCSAGVFKRARQIGRPCLLGYIGKCSAPCVERISEAEHRRLAEEFCDFMAGQTARFTRRLEAEMRAAAAAEEFERAARLRDDIQAPGAGAGETGGGPVRRHRLRRHRPGRGPARGRGPGVLRPRRPGPRPARVGGGQGRGRQRRRARRALPEPGVRRGQRRRERAGAGRLAGTGARDPGGTPGARAAVPREVLVPVLPPGAGRWRSGSRPGGGAGCTCGCRAAATRRRCSTPWRGTRPSRWRCTRPGGPATSPPAAWP